MPSRELLTAQAMFLGVSPELYIRGSEELRTDFMERHLAKLKKNAKFSPYQKVEDYVERSMLHYPRTEEDLKLKKTNSAEINKQKRRGRSPKVREVVEEISEEEDEQEAPQAPVLEPPYEMQGNVRVYHDMGDVGDFQGVDKTQRDGISVGPILETDKPVDLVGDRPPRTLADLYARWPIEGDPQYSLRLERTKPKTYQGVPVAGFVGEIRAHRITEVDIANRFGGSEYKITLYGPDPRGRTDEENRIKIKALTEPITLTVPVYPPIMTTIAENLESTRTMNPFGPMVAPPTTTGDASIHKANASFFSDAMKMMKEDFVKQNASSSQATSQIISVISESSKSQLELLQQQAKEREAVLLKQIEELRDDVKRAQQEKGTVATEVSRAKDEANTQLLKYMEKLTPDKQAEIARLQSYYDSQIDNMRRSHEDQMKALRESHQVAIDRLVETNKSHVDRLESRNRDVETQYRLLLEQERSQAARLLEQERTQSSKQLELERGQWVTREQQLRDQLRDQSSTERELSAQRIADLKERHAEEIKNLERSHERELRSLRDSADVKLTVSKDTSALMIKQAEERLKDAQEEAERAREEAEDAKDITKHLERAERTAELLGYEKKDANEPKGPWERLAATAGAGLSQAFAGMDQWLPAVMAARAQNKALAAAQQPPQLQGPQRVRPGQQPPMTQQQQQQPRQGGVEWARRGAQVRPRTAPVPAVSVQGPPPGFREEVAAPPMAAPPVQEVIPSMQPQVAPMSQPPPAMVQAAGSEEMAEDLEIPNIQFPEKFQQFFPNEAMIGFVMQAEQAVRDQVDPTGFATLMVSMYADGAKAMVDNFEPQELLEVVEKQSDTQSPLLRRDGRKWIDRLWKAVRKELKSQTALSAGS
jgi:hypothetical protein